MGANFCLWLSVAEFCAYPITALSVQSKCRPSSLCVAENGQRTTRFGALSGPFLLWQRELEIDGGELLLG